MPGAEIYNFQPHQGFSDGFLDAGRAIVRVLLSKGYQVTAVARHASKARVLLPDVQQVIEANATRPETLRGICSGQEVIISALGKSVSPNDWSRIQSYSLKHCIRL